MNLFPGGTYNAPGDLDIVFPGKIICNDPATPTATSACDITINVGGNLTMGAGTQINANNTVDGGHGGTISINVCGNLTMEGPGSGHPGALITSQHLGNGTDDGGQITVVVGCVTFDTNGNPVCGLPQGDILIEQGALITSNSNTHRAGDIALYAGHNILIQGSVTAQGTGGTGHGGLITIDACCDLKVDDTGLVSSKGKDPGADRVHLQGCAVTIFGLVESSGPGHQGPSPNCTPPIRPDRDPAASACVEIWSGTTLLVDATGTHHGQVNADVGQSGGTSGRGWIDALANGDITIIGNPGQPYNAGSNLDVNSLTSPAWALHANMALQNGFGGAIAVQSRFGNVTTYDTTTLAFSRAIQANASTGSNGGQGGQVLVEAFGTVALGQSSIQAMGDTTGGSPKGGLITVLASNGSVTGGPPPGQLDAAGPSTSTTTGTINLFGCTGTPYNGDEHAVVINDPAAGHACGDPVVFPRPARNTSPVVFPSANCSTSCASPTPTPTPTRTTTTTTVTVTPTVTPTPGIFCNKLPVLTVLAGRVPDVIVRTDLGQSIQAAVNTASDTNGDGFIIIGVVNNGTGALGGHVSQRVTISQVYPKPFLLFGCSVTMHDPNKGDGLPTGLIASTAGSPANIFVMDLHGADSEVAGWKVVGNGRTLRNTGGSGSATGIWFVGNNNTMHNGAASGNTGVGLLIQGDSNVATDTDTFSNGSHGVQVIGNSNQLLKIDTGEIGKGNGGDGMNVSGTGNLLSETTARSNSSDGIRVTNSGNTLTKNDSGGTASQNNAGCEFEVVAFNTNGGGNKANGVAISGNPFPTGCLFP